LERKLRLLNVSTSQIFFTEGKKGTVKVPRTNLKNFAAELKPKKKKLLIVFGRKRVWCPVRDHRKPV